ncbi:MAG TPA: sulfatase-like hydrolase/transferase [Gemmataceae bacterium]|nr:sulfatase-like hydrolase/transferase [Gemmataceae bacterium]
MKVIVLHASALHLGFLGCYGNSWISTPTLDRLASEGVVFDQHFADDVGHRTCWTGQYRRTSSAAGPPLADLLHAAGCRFVHVDGNGLKASDDATPLEQTLDAAVSAIEELIDHARWLCWIDLPALQPPWQVSHEFTDPYLASESDEDEEDDEPFDPWPNPHIGPLDADDLVLWERLRCTYAGAVTYLDAGLGLLLEEMKQQKVLDDVTLIFTADRGLALGEHGIVGDCRPWLHDEVVHVPLIVRQPGGTNAGRRVFALTQPVDVAASLLEMCGATPPPLDGRSWLPMLAGNEDTLRQHCISTWSVAGWEEWALRTTDCALLLPIKQPRDLPQRQVQFYLKPEDRWEANNVIQHHLDLAEQMEATLRGLLRT